LFMFDFDFYFLSFVLFSSNNRIQIYNRNGNMVYESNNYQNYWDGISSGKNRKLPAAPYYYVLSVDGGSKIVEGWLYINY
jgi:gliding motility-associated-like protein